MTDPTKSLTAEDALTDADDICPQLGNETSSFEQLYCDMELHFRRISVRKFGIPEDDAKTIVHDVFISYLANPSAVRGDLRAYLFGAIRNQCCNYWRAKRYERRVFSADDIADLDDTAKLQANDFFNELSLEHDIAATLDRLDPRCREALTLHFMNVDVDAIAELLHTTPSNVHNVIHRCRKRARDIYGEITQVS